MQRKKMEDNSVAIHKCLVPHMKTGRPCEDRKDLLNAINVQTKNKIAVKQEIRTFQKRNAVQK